MLAFAFALLAVLALLSVASLVNNNKEAYGRSLLSHSSESDKNTDDSDFPFDTDVGRDADDVPRGYSSASTYSEEESEETESESTETESESTESDSTESESTESESTESESTESESTESESTESESTETESESSTESESTESESTESEEEMQGQEVELPETGPDAIGLASNNPDFSTLVSAIQAADLVDALSGEGPFTIFAPNNAAFDNLPAGTIDSLLQPENKETLQSILGYHVVSGVFTASDLVNRRSLLTTLNGQRLNINGYARPRKRAVGINAGQAEVIAADIFTTNAVIHVIDGVLLPDTNADNGRPAGGAAGGGGNNNNGGTGGQMPTVNLPTTGPDVFGIAESNDDFLTLVTAVQQAELASALQAAGPFTIFAPNNAAFDALPSATLAALLEEGNKEELANVLTFHVVEGAYTADAFVGRRTSATALNGQTLTIDGRGSGVVVNGATVISADILGTNGVIHVIDSVLVPDDLSVSTASEEESEESDDESTESDDESESTGDSDDESESTGDSDDESESTEDD